MAWPILMHPPLRRMMAIVEAHSQSRKARQTSHKSATHSHSLSQL